MILGSQLIVEENEIRDFEGLKESLTYKNPEYVTAKRMGNHWRLSQLEEEFIYMYSDSSGKYYKVPRNCPSRYFTKTFFNDERSSVPFKRTARFISTLREYQNDFYEEFDPLSYDDHILEISCGLGKTVMALYNIAQRQQRTVVLVPTNKLLGQWYREAIKHLKGVKIGFSNPKYDTDHYEQYDILILSQVLARERNLGEEFFSQFGYSIWDEGQTFGSGGYIPLIEECPTKYRSLLTATFRRKDGNHKLLSQHFGERLEMKYKGVKAKFYGLNLSRWNYQVALKYDINDKTKEKITFFGSKVFTGGKFVGFSKPGCVGLSSDTTLSNKVMKFKKNVNFSALNSLSTAMPRKNALVANFIHRLLASGKNVLVLSKRKDILKQYNEIFKDLYKTYLVISETSDDHTEEDMNVDARLILGIQQLTEFGFNVPRMDTLLLLHPITDTEQAIGRILRQFPEKQFPLAICVVDNNLYLRKLFMKAVKEFVPLNAEYQALENFHTLCQTLNLPEKPKTNELRTLSPTSKQSLTSLDLIQLTQVLATLPEE